MASCKNHIPWLVLLLLLNSLKDSDCRKHDHHRAHRSRRHHHESSDSFITGSSHNSQSKDFNSYKNFHFTPHGHHHHANTHHTHKKQNNRQFSSNYERSYDTKYETSYVKHYSDYDDEVLPEKVYPVIEAGEVPEKIKIHSIHPIMDDQYTQYDTNSPVKVPSKTEGLSAKVKDNFAVASELELSANVKRKGIAANSDTGTRTNVPIERWPENNSDVKKKNTGKIDIEHDSSQDIMLSDSPRMWSSKNKKLFSPNALTQKQASSGVAANSVVKARGLAKRPRNKGIRGEAATGTNRWTLTYQGGPSETALNNSVTNITAQIGGDAFLPCRVGHLGDRQISWIRSRDWHVLTSGNEPYTSDRRFTVLHEPGTQDWTLHIKYVTPRDNGTYECQVSTGTGIISLFVNITVVTPVAHIPGRGQYHVNKGSPIVLTCVISESPTPPRYVFWYHNGQLLNFLRNRRDFTISLQQSNADSNDNIDAGLLDESKSYFASGVSSLSKLDIEFAEDRHSGNYTCSAPKTLPASTLVFVTEGDKTAAVQRIDSSGCSGPSAESRSTMMCLILSLLWLSFINKSLKSLSLSHAMSFR